MNKESLYRVRFISQDQLFDVYARKVYQGEMYGFVIIEDLVFDTGSSVVVDPSEEKLKREFDGVRRSIVPMHAIVRIDSVEKRGTAKIADLDGKIARFPSPVYTPGQSES